MTKQHLPPLLTNASLICQRLSRSRRSTRSNESPVACNQISEANGRPALSRGYWRKYMQIHHPDRSLVAFTATRQS